MKSNTFSWAGTSKSGKKISGEIAADTICQAKIYLYSQGIKLQKIRRKIILFSQKIQPLDLILFFRQLSLLLHSGVAMVQACGIILSTQKNNSLQVLISTLITKIESGSSLSQSLKLFPNYFDAFVCRLITIGEQTGKLDELLIRSAKYLEKKMLLKKQILQALFYPIIISIVAIIVTLIMLIFIVPRFAELFQNMHHQLPEFTQIVITLSETLRAYYWLTVIPIAGLILFYYRYTYSASLQYTTSQIILKIPLIGIIINKIILARFTQNLATMFNAGITITDSLTLLTDGAQNPLYIKTLQKIQFEIAKGMPLNSAILANPLFPTFMGQMIKVGEESGQLAVMLEKITLLFEEEIESFVSYLNLLLEPLIMIILGVLIGGLVVAMYLPIFKLGTVF